MQISSIGSAAWKSGPEPGCAESSILSSPRPRNIVLIERPGSHRMPCVATLVPAHATMHRQLTCAGAPRLSQPVSSRSEGFPGPRQIGLAREVSESLVLIFPSRRPLPATPPRWSNSRSEGQVPVRFSGKLDISGLCPAGWGGGICVGWVQVRVIWCCVFKSAVPTDFSNSFRDATKE